MCSLQLYTIKAINSTAQSDLKIVSYYLFITNRIMCKNIIERATGIYSAFHFLVLRSFSEGEYLLKEGVVEEHHGNNQKYDRHTAAGFEIVFGFVAPGRHHQGVYLMRWKHK